MISITGLKEIDQVIKRLPEALQHNVVAAAHIAAAKVLVEKEKLLAPEGPTGNLVDSIGAVKTAFKRAKVVGEVIVGPRRGGRYKGFAGHLVEYGTKRRRTKSGANRGIMPAKPFAKPAFTQTKGEIERQIGIQLGRSVVRTMKRYLK